MYLTDNFQTSFVETDAEIDRHVVTLSYRGGRCCDIIWMLFAVVVQHKEEDMLRCSDSSLTCLYAPVRFLPSWRC